MSTTPQGERPGALALFAVAAGPRFGEQLQVPAPVVHIGRGAQNEVVVDDDSVSAVHARLEYDIGGWRLTDLDSTNGTSVEGVRLTAQVPTLVQYGATVRLGGVRLQFREVDRVDLDAARAEYVPPKAQPTLREERGRAGFPIWAAVLLLLLVLIAVGVFLFGGELFAPSSGTATVTSRAVALAPAVA